MARDDRGPSRSVERAVRKRCAGGERAVSLARTRARSRGHLQLGECSAEVEPRTTSHDRRSPRSQDFVYRSVRDGYVHDPLIPDRQYNDKDTFAGRGSLYFTPTEDFKVILNVDFDRENPAATTPEPEDA